MNLWDEHRELLAHASSDEEDVDSITPQILAWNESLAHPCLLPRMYPD